MTNGTFGHDVDLFLMEVFHVIFHFGGKEMGADAHPAQQRERVVAHALGFIHQTPIGDSGELALDETDEHILVAHAMAFLGQYFRIDPRGDDVVKIPTEFNHRRDDFEQPIGFIKACWANDQHLAVRQFDHLARIGTQGKLWRTQEGL
jgi:hypothetical protein